MRQQAKDKEKFTAEERLAFVKQANKLEEEQAKRNVDLATREFELLRKRSEWAENDAETMISWLNLKLQNTMRRRSISLKLWNYLSRRIRLEEK